VCKNPAAGAKKKETTSKILLSRPVSDKQQQNAKAKSKNASHTVYLHKMSEVDGKSIYTLWGRKRLLLSPPSARVNKTIP